jgi:release factor glutamine methyltransferase
MTETLSFDQVMRDAARQLAAAGVDTAALDARLLLCRAAGVSHANLIAQGNDSAPANVVDALEGFVARRLAGEPVARILGTKEFWGLPIQLGPETLDPRPDSEAIVSAALDAFSDRGAPLRVLDLGTGSGCLLLAVLSERPNATGLGVDLSSAAINVARQSADALGLAARVRFAVGDWAKGLNARFDVVLSNPPYIRSGEISGLADEVRKFDPPRALDGGPDGLAPYLEILPALPSLLTDGGRAFLETSPDLYAELFTLAQDVPGLAGLEKISDLAGRARGLAIGKANFST